MYVNRPSVIRSVQNPPIDQAQSANPNPNANANAAAAPAAATAPEIEPEAIDPYQLRSR